ncbi:hypothetical protein H0H92_010461 [Tricholoma furcatifolium]|nr:hypothetical protein H0H92_010461 [Tricholoma furcatifolium]
MTLAHSFVRDQDFRQMRKNSKYYIKGGDIHFLVENQLFCVHSYFFERESSVFRESIQASLAATGARNGGIQCVAIFKLNVTVSSFEKLLGIIYNKTYSLFDGWSVDDWTTVLHLIQNWEFPVVRDLAVRELEKCLEIPLIERISLYHRFKVNQSVLIPWYGRLCGRPEALTHEESEAIGNRATVFIFQARERLRARPSDGGRSPLPNGLDDKDIHRTLEILLEATSSPDGQNGKLAGL